MFRKIHSNRDPKTTLWSEVRKEFGPYFDKAGSVSLGMLRSHPKPFYWIMIIFLLLSAGLSFTVFREHPTAQSAKVVVTKAPARKPVDDGFDRILETGAALKRTLQLRGEVEAIMSKGKLDHADSLILEGALDSLGQIQKQFNH